MNAKIATIGLAAAVLLVLAGAGSRAQQAQPAPRAPEAGVSDAGSFGAIPYEMWGYVTLRPEEKATLRKLEDKHIAEMRALEDHHDQELRALRLKQNAEREALLKSLTRR
jgi:Spy/CpxP family protein refolding chaperone